MSNKWRFKIDLKDEEIFRRIEKVIGKEVPEEIKIFVKNYNAASPDLNCVIINGRERIVDSVLSFNCDETEAITFQSAFNAINNDSWIPFAADPFGNYFCYSLETNVVGYFEHEEQKIDKTGYTLKEFVQKLY